MTNELLGHNFVAALRADVGLWYRLVSFTACAIVLPSAFKWLGIGLKSKSVPGISMYSDGFEALMEETRFEAAQWDPRWSMADDEPPRLLVETVDEHRFIGELVWRSTAPHPIELIVTSVIDVTDPETPMETTGLLLLQGESINRLWIMRPDTVMSATPRRNA